MTQVSTTEKSQIVKLRAPNKFHVIMLNDDATPMDFVINILVQIYNKSPEQAKEVMIEIHEKGRGVAGAFSYEVAEQKCTETVTVARRHNFPLEVTIEES
jgi:ATP-dependent Clp protease adaptor protein ClpS